MLFWAKNCNMLDCYIYQKESTKSKSVLTRGNHNVDSYSVVLVLCAVVFGAQAEARHQCGDSVCYQRHDAQCCCHLYICCKTHSTISDNRNRHLNPILENVSILSVKGGRGEGEGVFEDFSFIWSQRQVGEIGRAMEAYLEIVS